MEQVAVFFYGSYMNPDVLKSVNMNPAKYEVARLNGFDIVIGPRANLIPSDQACVYGILTRATHAELDRLYAHARDVLGEVYLPHAVLAETVDGHWQPALCYISNNMKPGPPAKDYVDRILKPARDFGFPQWYIERLEEIGRS